ncbi:MAG: T9SS type A sorting domain-containing protein [Bacteroidales bacterium]|jgi:hypothetical protein|nr:T9SS type A sorting domain-containing protein [Bacteroidales bacterium]
MKRNLPLFVIFLLFNTLIVNAQENRYSKVYYDQNDGIHVQATAMADNDSILIGSGPYRGGLHLFDGAGTLHWSKSIGYAIPKDILQTADGHFVVCANGISNSILLFKMDIAGNILWTKKYQNEATSFASGMHLSANGDILLTGHVMQNTYPYNKKTLFLRLSTTGDLVASKTYSLESGRDEGVAITETQNGDILIAGLTKGNSSWAQEMCIVKTDAEGNLIWTKSKTSENPFAWSSINDMLSNDGLIFISGHAFDVSTFALCMDNDGIIVWSKEYSGVYAGNDAEYRPRMRQDQSGKLLVSYSSSMFMGGIVIAINPEGEYIWSQFPSMAQYDAQPLSDGGYLFIGNGPLWGVKDVSEPQIGLVRVNDMGEGISCTEPILSSAFEYQINFEAITYTSEETGTISDYILETTEFPLASFIGCVTFVGNTQERPDRKNSLKIQPNPGNPPFLLNLKGIHNEVVASLIIYDSKGRKIYQEEGSWQQLQLIQRKLKSGLYLIKVTVEGFDYVSKLIVAEE